MDILDWAFELLTKVKDYSTMAEKHQFMKFFTQRLIVDYFDLKQKLSLSMCFMYIVKNTFTFHLFFNE